MSPLPPVGTTAQACPERSRRGCPAGQSPAVLRSGSYLPPGSALALGLIILVFAPLLSASDCIPIHQASQHVGETKCVAGKVLKIRIGNKGVHFLDFCADQMACPFTVVVFPSGLKDDRDVIHLEGSPIAIPGAVKLNDGHLAIIVSRISQITGGDAMIPPPPKNYDVYSRGHYSAGLLRPTKK